METGLVSEKNKVSAFSLKFKVFQIIIVIICLLAIALASISVALYHQKTTEQLHLNSQLQQANAQIAALQVQVNALNGSSTVSSCADTALAVENLGTMLSSQLQNISQVQNGTYQVVSGLAIQLGNNCTATCPTVPAPVPVNLQANQTAFLVLDITDIICIQHAGPRCQSTVPIVQNLLNFTRAHNVITVYTGKGYPPIAALANQTGDFVVGNDTTADKYYGTSLNAYLQSQGIVNTLIVGVLSNGAVMYTAFESAVRNYTCIVAVDGMSSASDYVDNFVKYQLLNQPSRTNPSNAPLTPAACTLTTSTMISFY
jgi:cell division protein FtsL